MADLTLHRVLGMKKDVLRLTYSFATVDVCMTRAVTIPKCTFRAYMDADSNFHSFRGLDHDVLRFSFLLTLHILQVIVPSDDTKVHFPSTYGCGFKLSQFLRAR